MKPKPGYEQHLDINKSVTASDVANFKTMPNDVLHDVIFSLHESIERMTRNIPSGGPAMFAPFMAILVALSSFAVVANFTSAGLLLFWLSLGVVAVSIVLPSSFTMTSTITWRG